MYRSSKAYRSELQGIARKAMAAGLITVTQAAPGSDPVNRRDAQRAEAAKLLAQGLSYTEISGRIGVSRGMVHKLIRSLRTDLVARKPSVTPRVRRIIQLFVSPSDHEAYAQAVLRFRASELKSACVSQDRAAKVLGVSLEEFRSLTAPLVSPQSLRVTPRPAHCST